MKKVHLIFVLLVSLLSNTLFSQTEKQEGGAIQSTKVYFGFGGGFCIRGAGASISGTLILPDYWGGSVRYNTNLIKAKNLPDDYYDLVLFIPFAINGFPGDKLQSLSFNILKEFPTSNQWLRFGIEAGPAWVNYSVANFTPQSSVPFFGSNYIITRETKNSIGFSFEVKTEFPISRFVGLEMSVHTNLNKYQSIFGINFCFTAGLVR